MGYFANGYDADLYEAKYCTACAHGGDRPGEICPVMALHLDWNYEQHTAEEGDTIRRQALEALIPTTKEHGNGACALWTPVHAGAPGPLPADASQPVPMCQADRQMAYLGLLAGQAWNAITEPSKTAFLWVPPTAPDVLNLFYHRPGLPQGATDEVHLAPYKTQEGETVHLGYSVKANALFVRIPAEDEDQARQAQEDANKRPALMTSAEVADRYGLESAPGSRQRIQDSVDAIARALAAK